MATDVRTLKVDQCLFGYDEGHHLLASSVALTDDVLARLLPLSDLAPGLSIGRDDSYWTGVPLPAAKQYALMRTWSAWEMRRPGCVWSHALLVDFADVPELDDLSTLGQHVRRPDLGDYKEFKRPLVLELQAGETRSVGSSIEALGLLREIYTERTGTFQTPHIVDSTIFAIWSQQWPRLRRAFSFRTASSSLEVASSTRSLDLLVTRGTKSEALPATKLEQVAVDDLESATPTDCRRFLWRYGSDLRNGRERYWFLIEAFTLSNERLAGERLVAFVERVETLFSSQAEARVLKEDLASCGFGQYALFGNADFFELYSLLLEPKRTAFATPTADTLRIVIEHNRKDAFRIGSLALTASSAFTEPFLEALLQAVELESFGDDTKDLPDLRRWIIDRRPEVLTEDLLATMATSQVIDLFVRLKNDSRLANLLVRNLFKSDSEEAARVCAREALPLALDLCADALESELTTPLADAWRSILEEHAETFLRDGYLDRARTFRGVSRAARWLGYDTAQVLRTGPAPWSRIMSTVQTVDVDATERDCLLAFLFVVATTNPTADSQNLLELTFEPLHKAIEYSRLASKAFAIVARHLPDVEWWRRWDNCGRLRLLTVETYISVPLKLVSFRRLIGDNYVRNQLVEIAEDSKRGRRFLKSEND